jgi:amino acid adenylation domain-containing protein
VLRELPGTRVTNGYGPTESTVFTTIQPILTPPPADEPLPIGRPIAATDVYLLDGHLDPVPQGVTGELCVGGDGLARGYLNRPELTAQRFVPSLVGEGRRIYRSGDLARLRGGWGDQDGAFHFVGRVDNQVKIRGFRIEPGETEQALGRHPEVGGAAAVVLKDPAGERRLVAYVVPRVGSAPRIEDLRGYLKSQLLEAQVPSAWVFLDSLPLTPNSKVDRRHLPAPDWGAALSSYVAPRTPLEERIAAVWSEVLKRERVGVEDDFFLLGGHSLLATQLLSRLERSLGVELSLRELFAKPTVAALAALAAITDALPAGREALPLVRAGAGEERVLSFSQERLWFLDQLEPGRATYNVPQGVALHGAPDLPALLASLGEVVRRHEALRTRYTRLAGRPRPVVEELRLSLPVVDLAALPGERREELARSLGNEEARRPFDLARGPVLRATLLKLAEREHRLLLTIHHIACDGWSLGVLVAELTALYGAFSQGLPSPLSEPALQYSDYALWQRRWLSGEVLEGQLSYWRQRLAGAPQRLALPTDRPRPAVKSGLGGAVTVAVPAALHAALHGLASERRATLFMALLAGWTALLARYSGQRDLLVGSAVANRTRPEIEGLVGFFVNTLVLRGEIPPEAGFADLLTGVRAAALEAYAHQDLPFEKLVDELVSERSPGVPPLVQVLLALEGRAWGAAALPALPGLTLDLLLPEVGAAKFDLSLELREADGLLSGRLEYSRDLFDRVTIERMRGHLLGLLAAAAGQPERRLSELSLLTEPEREELRAWNATAASYAAAGSTLPELLAAQAARTPDATAVVFEETALSYGELASRALLLAGHLRGLGVGPEVPVGICCERSLELVVGLVAILQAGGAYLPLDPSYPEERLARMLEDALPAVVLCGESTAGLLPAYAGRRVVLGAASLPAPRALPPGAGVAPENLAYVIFTSGSTGRPKGAMNRQRAIVNRLLWAAADHGITPRDRVLQKTPVSFDVSVWELFLPLLSGACLVVARPGGHQDPAYLARTLAEREITVAHFVPAMLDAFLGEPGSERATALRLVTASGEALPVSLAERFFARLPGVILENLYGPTEAAVDVTSWLSTPGSPVVPIGRPVANTAIHLRDQDGQEVPIGVPGELHIGGVQLARGYLRRPDLTAERFVPDPLGEPGGRLYRTGDLARRLPGGEIEYLGRIDNQVKLRGFRIELGEIEATLSAHPGVRHATVMVREDTPGDRRLVAYVVPQGEPAAAPPIAAAELRQALRATLPEHMIPAAVVFLAALPVTANGKLDRRALPAPPSERREEGVVAYALPQSATERWLAGIWQEVLGVETVGLDDNFFDLGGHSLRMAEVHARLEAERSPAPSMTDLFRFPTVRALAAHLSAGAEQKAESASVPLAVRRRSPVLAGERPHVAIIGMAGRFPDAPNPRELWRNLCRGLESVRFFSDEELLAAGVASELLAHPSYVRARGYLEGVDLFDAPFFGYNPREAETIDPQQRIFLECAWEALEDAGYDPERYPGVIGLYAGAGISTYLANLWSRPDLAAKVGELQVLLGNDKDYLATRVSYKLNLRGPSVAVQTACSTSLVAVHMASESLVHGECDMALAGGVTLATAKTGYLYQESGILSPDGHCRAFDADGRGTVAGSGAGVVVLKRLDRALADGDSIYAVIRGSGVNNDGSAKVGFTAPSVSGQAAVIAEAQAVAGVPPGSIGYVEAHGTGTALGDPIEVAALSQVLSPSGERGFCALGSIKTNLGHMDAAAGVAGLMKAALALQHRQIPPSLHFRAPNPQIDFANGPVYVNTELRDWPAAGTPRRAGVSSFGIGGTNAHAVLEEAPPAPAAAPARGLELLVLSARSAAALDAATGNLARHLEENPGLDLADVAYTLETGRRAFGHRRMLVCRDTADAAAALTARDPRRLLGGVAAERERPIVFLLPGQGAQHVNMGLDLYRAEPTFRAQIDRCAELLLPRLGWDLRQVLYPAPAEAEEAARRLPRPDVSNPILFAVETALALLWREWGITPRAMIGYSFGEYVAAYLSGVFTLEDALSLIVDRAAMLAALPPGSMLAVPLPEADLAPLLGDGLSLAAVNGPAVSVAAGTPERIAELDRELAGRGVACRPVPMPYAAHSFMLDPLLEPFAERMAKVPMNAPRIPYVANTTGTWVTPEQATDPREWARHLRLPVRFAAGLQAIFADPDAILLEVGPGRSLGTLARGNDATRTVLSSMRHAKEEVTDVEALLTACGRLWLAGVPVDWQGHPCGRPGRRRVSLPTYPFERQRYWIDRREPSAPLAAPGIAAGSPEAARAARPAVTIEWEPGMSEREIEAVLARVLASGEAEVVLSRRDLTTAREGSGASAAGQAAAPGHTRPDLGTPYVAPSNPIEEQLAALWEDLLGIGGIGVHDNFYELGGHSLLATQLISRVREQFAVAVPLEDFFSEPTIADLSLRVAQGQADRLDESELAQLLAEAQDLSAEDLNVLLAADSFPER